MKAWLARENWRCNGAVDFYVLAYGKKLVLSDGGTTWYADNSLDICPRLWVRAGGMKLKPGKGPVRVEFSVACKAVKC